MNVKGAHRLVLMREEDQGLQACSVSCLHLRRFQCLLLVEQGWRRGCILRITSSATELLHGFTLSRTISICPRLGLIKSRLYLLSWFSRHWWISRCLGTRSRADWYLSWIGCVMLLAGHRTGISGSRAALSGWCREQAVSDRVHLFKFEEAVGKHLARCRYPRLGPCIPLSPLEVRGPGRPWCEDVASSLREALTFVPRRPSSFTSACLTPSNSSSTADVLAGRCPSSEGVWFPCVDGRGHIVSHLSSALVFSATHGDKRTVGF